ncbi:peptidoglycan DD-metalloendopeptidase family protein [Actinosynnema sp. NPDC020468]|uniref:peptidoglycan DD-metalloendopeptidase family protein n=1 Tax=Actinosynnema sp. NPDC020468 TaxID=3154488 RepID=UPI0034045ABE
MKRVLVALVAPLVGLVLVQGEATAAPAFQLPFPCGQVWEGQTRTGHSPANSVDFNRSGDDGDPVVAAAGGTVTRVANEGATSYGRWVELDHGGGYRTRYAHLSAQRVTVGQSVRQGQQIGNVGSTGGSTGPHLHFEERLNGVDVKAVFNGAQALYWGTRSYTSRNSCSGVAGTIGTDSGASVTVRSGPGTSYAAVGSVADGATVTISCQAKGSTVTGKYGTTDLWDRIGPGYVSDAYVYTGSDGRVAPDC